MSTSKALTLPAVVQLCLGALTNDDVLADQVMAHFATSTRLQRLIRIQVAFGFPLSILYQILKCSRTQLYEWLDTKAQVDLQGESLQRLVDIERFAQMWLKECSATLYSVARELLPSGATIVDLLSETILDEATIAVGFRFLVGLANAQPPSASERLVKKGFERRGRTLPDDD